MYKELIKQLDNLQDRNMLLNGLLIDIISSCQDMNLEIQAVDDAKKILFKLKSDQERKGVNWQKHADLDNF